MAFTVSDFNDLLHLLAENPQWQVELRRHIVSEDLAALPGIVRELAEAQNRAEQRLERLEGIVRDLVENVHDLVQNQVLAERRLAGVESKLGGLDGKMLEFDRKAPAYFGRWLRRPRVVSHERLWERLEPHLSAEQRQDALLIDLVVEGQAYEEPGKPTRYLAVEVSSVCDSHDVERAIRRARLFRQAGLPALPAVAGRTVTDTALTVARELGVVVVDDGRGRFWDEALAKWPADSLQ